MEKWIKWWPLRYFSLYLWAKYRTHVLRLCLDSYLSSTMHITNNTQYFEIEPIYSHIRHSHYTMIGLNAVDRISLLDVPNILFILSSFVKIYAEAVALVVVNIKFLTPFVQNQNRRLFFRTFSCGKFHGGTGPTSPIKYHFGNESHLNLRPRWLWEKSQVFVGRFMPIHVRKYLNSKWLQTIQT